MATIQGVYIALFGRPADPLGLSFFEQVTNNGANLTAIGDLSGTAEYQNRFTGFTNTQIINSIYQSLFGRDADLAGLTFFTNALAKGTFNINNIAIAILDGAQGNDKVIVDTKIAAANAFTAQLDTAAEILGYSGFEAAAAGRAFISGITTVAPTAAEVSAAVAVATSFGVDPVGKTFTLTTAIGENIVGTNGADTFNVVVGADATFNDFDKIEGGAGRDVLNVLVKAGAAASLPTGVTGVEVVNISGAVAGLGTVDASKIPGAQQIWQIGAEVAVENLGATQTAGFRNISTGALEVEAAGASASVALDMVGEAATLAVTGASLSSVAVSGTRVDGVDEGTAVGALTLNVTAGKDVQAITVNSAVDAVLSVSDDASALTKKVTSVDASASAGKITFVGDADVRTITTGAAGDTVTIATETVKDDATTTDKDETVNASVSTGAGNDTITVSTKGTGLTVVDAGAGNDRVIASAINANTTLMGGEGRDTLVLTSAVAAGVTAASMANVSGFEVVEVSDALAASLNASRFAGNDIVLANGFVNTGAITGLASGSNITVGAASTGTLDLTVTGADVAGSNSDSVNLVLTQKTGSVDFGTIAAAAVENINLSVVDSDATTLDLNATVALSAAALRNLTVSGDAKSANLGTLVATTETVNTTAFTGAVSLSIAAAGTNGVLINTGAGADNIIGGDGADRISTGAGNDTVDGGKGADTIDGGAGDDVLFGRSGNDVLIGGDGDDILQGDGISTNTMVPATNEKSEVVFSANTLLDNGAVNGSTGLDGTLTFNGATIVIAADASADDVAAAVAAGTYDDYTATVKVGATNTVVFTNKVTGNAINIDASAFVFTAGEGDGDPTNNSGDGPTATVGNITDGADAVAGTLTISLGGDTAGADILTGGAGKDTFRFAAGSSNAVATDTITDLNLGTNALAGRVDILAFQNAGATASIVNLSASEQASVTAAANLAAAVALVGDVASSDGATAMFTFGTDTYIFHNVDGDVGFNGAQDILVKVTGVTGTLDLSDISLI